jgi:hypothetical protein
MRFVTLLSFAVVLSSCAKTATTPELATEAVTYVDDDLDGPIGRPSSGYGKDGDYTVAKISFPSPLYEGKYVDVFYPAGITTPKPTIFYSHPYGGEESEYNIGLFSFIAKKGYVVVFAPYPTNDVTIDFRYNTLWESFITAVKNYPNLIDTTKVGFMGHSFGGGASWSLAHKAFKDLKWGAKGRFIFTMAQWYSYNITPDELKEFPSNTKLISQVYDDDVTNDHRLAIDMFKNNNIPNAEKDFILVKKSILSNYTYTAEHNLPNSRSAYDAYDYYAVYRLLDAMMDYSWNGNANAKNVALGNGSAKQITLPSYNGVPLSPLVVTDNPVPAYPQDKYLFKCFSEDNPRIGFCQ